MTIYLLYFGSKSNKYWKKSCLNCQNSLNFKEGIMSLLNNFSGDCDDMQNVQGCRLLPISGFVKYHELLKWLHKQKICPSLKSTK